MPSLQFYSSFDELKADRVERTLTSEEKVRQKNATQSLRKIKRITTPLLVNGKGTSRRN